MIVCIAGKNDIASVCLEYVLSEYDDEIVALPCRSDDGTNTWQRSLLATAKMNGVSVVSIEDLYSEDDLLLFSLEYDRLLDVEKFRSEKLFNIHFSLLPAYRGSYTSIWPILNGESKSGATLHEIDAGIDTGPVVDQVEFPITVNDTGRSLYGKYLKYGAMLFIKNFPCILRNSYVGLPQSVVGASFYSRKSIDFSHIPIDLKKTAFEVHNQVRAFVFPEYQLPELFGGRIKNSWITDERSVLKPGTVVGEDALFWRIATIDYNVVLEKADVDRFL